LSYLQIRGKIVERFCKNCKTYGAAARFTSPDDITTYKCLNPDCGYITVIRPKRTKQTKKII